MRVATTAPLPEFADWVQLFRGRDHGDDSLHSVWEKGIDRTVWFSRGAWALRAVARALGKALRRPPLIWFPDYFCGQPIGPLRHAGAEIAFYPVRRTLEPDWDTCDRMAERRSPDLFVLVHYFGMAADTGSARAFASRAGAILLEDAAHALAPTDRIGQTGDLVLFSLYKHLPLPDGAVLQVRSFDAALTDETGDGIAPGTARWVAKRGLQSFLPGIGSTAASPAAFDDDPPPSDLPVTPAMSAVACRLLGGSRRRLESAAARRRDNARALFDLFDGADGLTPLNAGTGDGAVPYRAVFRAADHDAARRWYSRIRTSGNVVESWPDLPPEVRADPAIHAAAIELRNRVLCLPVHADRTPGELIAAYGAAL